jgi:lipoprotein LpqH
VKKRLVAVTGVALVIGGVAGCSSNPGPAPLQPGMLAAGTATVTIDGKDAGTTQAVQCLPAGTLTTITTGDDASGVTAIVSSAAELSADAVNIHNLGGFTGSYTDGLDNNNAKVSMTGRTYDISGTADGFTADNPSARVPGTFAIKVSC